MGKITRDVSRNEGMEEIVNKTEKLQNRIENILSAGPRVASTLVLTFPDKSVDWLVAFWTDIRDAVVDDYEYLCTKMI